MESSRRSYRVSTRQLDLLWDFLNSNRDIACAFNRTLRAKEYSKKKWQEIAEILNAQGDGAHKDWVGWCKYWVDYKAKIKKRVGALRASHAQTGGGPSSINPLSDQDKKFLDILGGDFGHGMPGVRVEPPPEINIAEVDSGSSTSQSILQNVSIEYIVPLTTNHPTILEPILAPPVIQEPSLLSTILGEPPPTSTNQEPPPTAASIRESPLTPPNIREPPVHPATTPIGCSPRHRRRRRDMPMSQEAARRALVRASQIYSDAAVRTADGVERAVEVLAQFRDSFMRIERILHGAFPTTAEQVNFE